MTQQEKIPFPDTSKLAPQEAAGQWLSYHQSGVVCGAGKNAFYFWLSQSPENQQAYSEAEQLWQDLGFALLQDAPDEKPEMPSAGIEAKHKVSHRKEWLWGLAATLLIGLGTINIASQVSTDVTTASYASQIGEIKTLVLEDNSTVTLSADSALSIYFTGSQRELNLRKGRAYFEVAPDKDRPFIVRAGHTSATAVGTAFDVNNTADGVDVAVTHGMVDVRGFRDAEHTLHLGKEQLYAGQIIHAEANGKLNEPLLAENADALSWREGRLVFEGEKLSVITEEINRYRNKKIRLRDNVLNQRRITLSVPADKTELLISAIEASEPVVVFETDTEVVISLAGN